MSNKRRLKADGDGPVERCTSCTRKIGKNMDVLRVRTGQVICPRCRQYGAVPRLACGHYALPGSFVVRNEGGDNDVRCTQCARDSAALAGNARFGMGAR